MSFFWLVEILSLGCISRDLRVFYTLETNLYWCALKGFLVRKRYAEFFTDESCYKLYNISYHVPCASFGYTTFAIFRKWFTEWYQLVKNGPTLCKSYVRTVMVVRHHQFHVQPRWSFVRFWIFWYVPLKCAVNSKKSIRHQKSQMFVSGPEERQMYRRTDDLLYY